MPDPAAPIAPSLAANYGQNPSLQATRGIYFGSGSSLHPTYEMFSLKFPFCLLV